MYVQPGYSSASSRDNLGDVAGDGGDGGDRSGTGGIEDVLGAIAIAEM